MKSPEIVRYVAFGVKRQSWKEFGNVVAACRFHYKLIRFPDTLARRPALEFLQPATTAITRGDT
jgi:hypothetical protein